MCLFLVSSLFQAPIHSAVIGLSLLEPVFVIQREKEHDMMAIHRAVVTAKLFNRAVAFRLIGRPEYVIDAKDDAEKVVAKIRGHGGMVADYPLQ